jgi:hypothetical protein
MQSSSAASGSTPQAACCTRCEKVATNCKLSASGVRAAAASCERRSSAVGAAPAAASAASGGLAAPGPAPIRRAMPPLHAASSCATMLLLLLLKLLAAARTAGSSSGAGAAAAAAAAAAAGTPTDGESVVAPEPAADWRRFCPLLRRLQDRQRHGRMHAQGTSMQPHPLVPHTHARTQTHTAKVRRQISQPMQRPPVLLLLLLFLGRRRPCLLSRCRRRRRRCSSLLPSPLQLLPQVNH